MPGITTAPLVFLVQFVEILNSRWRKNGPPRENTKWRAGVADNEDVRDNVKVSQNMASYLRIHGGDTQKWASEITAAGRWSLIIFQEFES